MGFRRTRKGSVQDLYVIAVTVFTFALTLMASTKIYEGLNTYKFFSASPAMAAAGKALSIMDYGAVFLMVGLFASSIILASRIRTNPVFFPVSLLSLVVAVFVSAQLANVYAAMSQTGVFEAVANTLPFATKILYNFPLLIGAGGFMIILALYAR